MTVCQKHKSLIEVGMHSTYSVHLNSCKLSCINSLGLRDLLMKTHLCKEIKKLVKQTSSLCKINNRHRKVMHLDLTESEWVRNIVINKKFLLARL